MSELVSEFWPVQPEPGSVADQLIKKSEARGKAEEKRRTIRILQSILGVSESSDEALSGNELDDLDAIIESLRMQIASRPS